MEASKEKGKTSNNLITKTWERCKSVGRGRMSSSSGTVRALMKKSKSWSMITDAAGDSEDCVRKQPTRRRVATEKGCFSVYVGPEKQRFVIKTEYVNHSLFKVLLEEAETEYGFNSGGPLVLPCNVDSFCKVLLAIDDSSAVKDIPSKLGCGFPKGYGAYRLLNSPRMITVKQS
ncbi:hypothetical protein SLE2022_048550 [Rubroshorea leprosula]